MLLRRKECLQLKIRDRNHIYCSDIRLKQYEGQVQWCVGFFWVLFLGIVLCVQLQVRSYRSASLYLEDALAASNLASAVIDLQEYGKTHTIWIADPQEAYELYCDAVRGNLQLTEQWEGINRSLISGRVVVENYTVYNVKSGKVTVYSVDSDGQMKVREGLLGEIQAPNGAVIESTSVYSEISFPIEGIFGISVMAHKGKLVDVVGPDNG